ncbi:MAG: DNA polymerase I [Candidatus Saccharimonadales bacterium]
MPNLSTKDGIPTGGVYGFATMALEVIKRLKPDYVCIAWDKPKTNIRKRLAMYPEYKAGRKPPPPDFYEQIPVLHELLQAFGWPLYELDDYEADDIMGALAVQASAQGIDTLLITSDMDMLQLVNPYVKVFALKKGLSNIELYSPESFTAKYGIRVDQFLDLKSLKGDSSDNIPGVPGIGEKGAVELLQQYGTLDNVYENLGLLKDSTRKKLEAGKDSAYLSKKLAAIWTDAPITLDLNAVDGSKCVPEQVLAILQKLEFRTLARQLPEIMQVAIGTHQTSNHQAPLVSGTCNIVADPKGLAAINFSTGDIVYVHSRSAGKHGQKPQLLSLSFDGLSTYVIDIEKIGVDVVKKWLSQNVSSSTSLIGYDVKATLKLLLAIGITTLPSVGHDVLIGAFLLNSLRREQSLTDLAQSDLGFESSPFENLDNDELTVRAAEITTIIKALYEAQLKQMQKLPKIAALAREVEWPVIAVLADMEFTGIQLDTKYLSDFNEQITDQISDLEQQIYGYADTEFNISSPSQLSDILFVKLALPKQGVKKGKNGYSTAANELDKLRSLHPIIDLVSQFREVTKLKNTYVDTLPKLVDEQSRVHTTFNLTIAQTGRLSSTDPNLQNIPVRTDLGKHIRTAFIAGNNRLLVSADYSQFELRLAAYLANDHELVEMFNNGADVHTATAAQVYGRTPEEVTKQMRRDAKVINFGVLYGMSPHGLSMATGMTIVAAKNFIDKYFELRKPLLEYMNSLKEKARIEGYVETLFGRRRPTPDIHSSNFIVRQAAERAALNMPIQGTEADLMKMAMIRVQQKLEEWPDNVKSSGGPKQLLQVHDSILVECDQADAENIAHMLKETMEGVFTLPVKLTVDTTIGKNWGEL